MNEQKLQTFKWLVSLRLDRIRKDFNEGFIEQKEFNSQICDLLGSVITKFSENEDIVEVTQLFTKHEVISAFGLEEQHA